MRIEPLECRAMMANDLGAIGGVVFQDLTENGLTNDDARISGSIVTLYRDTGNGMLGNEDTTVGTRTTDATGNYRFDTLTPGTYFVQRSLPTGYIQRPGSDMAMIVITPQAADGQVGRMIDSFDSSAQSVTATSMGPRTDASSINAPEAIGGERDLFVNLQSAAGAISLQSNAFNQRTLEFTSTATGMGTRSVVWDGVDGSSNLNATGLGGVDITNAGANIGLRLSIGADLAGGKATFRVYSSAGNWSSATVDIPATGGAGTTEVIIPFTAFTTGAGAGANLQSVGAIQLDIEGNAAVDGQIRAIATVGPTVLNHNFALSRPMSLGNRVFNDVNNNGLLDNGENGIAGVSVRLFLDADNSGGLTNADTTIGTTTTDATGTYGFNNLLPGNYLVQLVASNFATGAVLADYLSSTGNQPTPGPNTNIDNDDNGDLVAGAIISGIVTLQNESEPVNDGDNNPNSNLTVDFGVFVPQIDLELDKSVSAAVARTGDNLTYTVFIRNNGPTNATGVKVIDTLPAGVTYLNSQTPGTVTVSGQNLTYNFGDMAVGATRSITILVNINATASGTLINNAVVSADQRETRLDNNQDSAQTVLETLIDLAIVKTGTPDVVGVNQIETYTLTVTNNGPANATGVIVTDTLPAGITFASATPQQGTFTVNGSVITLALGNLASGASTQITITGVVDAAARGTLVNVAEVRANEIETTYTNNRDDYPITVIPPAQAPNSSIAGNVYVDANNNAVKDAGEEPIAGVTVILSGTDNNGNAVNRTTQTAADGSYSFAALEAGIYALQELQPNGYIDGFDTVGTPAGGTAAQDDFFRNITLAANMNGVEYNFGERRPVLSKRLFLSR